MPKKKFGPDDTLYNTIKTYPKYIITSFDNQSYINNRQTQGRQVQSGTISLFELNVNRGIDENLIYPFIIKNQNIANLVFKNVTGSSDDILSLAEYNQIDAGAQITSSYPLSSSIGRELLVGDDPAPYTKFEVLDGVAETGSIKKFIALKNILNYNKIYSPKFDFNEYYLRGEISASYSNFADIGRPYQKYTTFFTFPEIFKGQEIKPGSVELNFYITGTLLATAKDSNRNGEIIETSGPRESTVVGTVCYREGVMVITGNYVLEASTTDGYLTPITGTATTEAGPGSVVLQSAWKDNPKWAHFGKYQSFITSSSDPLSGSYAVASSSYELKFKGTNVVPTLTMMCHADKNEMNWSNNLTYLDRTVATGSNYQRILGGQTGSAVYREGKYIPIKNTVSSSFANYSASYSDQTFISKINIFDKYGNIIAIAKTATPVTKNNNTDYTFKLKLDI
tara:strand:- start:10467 stop:11822 length:1356 start_codon:yes stop_codon:yes gene_type:complete